MIVNSKRINKEIKKYLYIVSTPIGNLNDISLRAIDTLKKSDYILCEDTRVSKNLLDKYKIKSKLISNHKFNEKKNLSKIIALIKQGLFVSLISDAGTPSISDPGAILIRECIKNNIQIIPLPGPSAAISAISISGFSEKYFFYGFFPNKKKDLNNDLKSLSNIKGSIVFFISPNKINDSIEYLKTFFLGFSIRSRDIQSRRIKYNTNSMDLCVHNLFNSYHLPIRITERGSREGQTWAPRKINRAPRIQNYRTGTLPWCPNAS